MYWCSTPNRCIFNKLFNYVLWEIGVEFIVILRVPQTLLKSRENQKCSRRAQKYIDFQYLLWYIWMEGAARVHLDELLIHSGHVPKYVESNGETNEKGEFGCWIVILWMSKNPDEELKSANMGLPFFSNCHCLLTCDKITGKWRFVDAHAGARSPRGQTSSQWVFCIDNYWKKRK